MNAGPGAIAGLFVHEKHWREIEESGIQFKGWWGHKRETRFVMDNVFVPATGASSFQLSNPSVFALIGLLGSLKVFESVPLEELFKKSKRLTTYLRELLEKHLTEEIEILTPKDAHGRTNLVHQF